MKSFIRFATLAFLLIGLVVALYARYVEPYRTRIKHVAVQLPRNQEHLAGLTVAFVSDTHVGPHYSANHLDPVADELEKIAPDLVIFGGDYVSESPRYIESTIVPLARMAKSATLGGYGVLGNHDVSNVRSRVSKALHEAGICLLVNEAHRVEFGGGEFWIVGIDDILLGRPDLAQAFADVPVDAPSIAVWHEPDWSDRAAPFGPFLQLSGHTHGGQIRVPGKGELALPRLGRRYPDGTYTIDDMTLLVSRGVGMYRPPVRFNCPPEVLLIHFVA